MVNNVSNIALMVELLKSIIASYVTRASQSQLQSASRAAPPASMNKIVPPAKTRLSTLDPSAVANEVPPSVVVSNKPTTTGLARPIRSALSAPKRSVHKDINPTDTSSKDTILSPLMKTELRCGQPPSQVEPVTTTSISAAKAAVGSSEDMFFKSAWNILSDIDKKTDRIFAFPVSL